MPEFDIAVFDGDGIGPEIMEPTLHVLDHVMRRTGSRLKYRHLPAGAAHYAETGEDLPGASVEAARDADAILLSAMGLPSIRRKEGTELTPQIDLRFALDLYAGVRPVRIYSPRHSPLRDRRIADIDFVLVRESTEGLFAHMHEGRIIDNDHALETMRITRRTSEKLFDFSFRLAERRGQKRGRKARLTCIDKANVFRSMWFFRSIFDERSQHFPSVERDYAYVDAMAMWMVQRPWEFDVMVTENMFGDILSDLGAGIMGTLGLAPSADIGDNHAVFQPCHGSAPDIAGKRMANPLAMILSGAMMLDWLGDRQDAPDLVKAAEDLEEAVAMVVRFGTHLTRDLGGTSSTAECAHSVIAAFDTLHGFTPDLLED